MPISPQITITPSDIATKIFDITNATHTATEATFTATGHTFSVGDIIIISEIAPDDYNGLFTITAIATNTFTVSNTVVSAPTTVTGQAFWADNNDYDYVDTKTDFSLTNSDSANIIAEAVADVTPDIAQAQATADGKNKIYRQSTSPGTTGNAIGDVWFNTSSDNAISRWDGTQWLATTLGNSALASISASKITAGTIDASVITVSNLDAGNITSGIITGRTLRTSSNSRRVEVDANNQALSFYDASNNALGHIRPASDYAGVIISSGGSATSSFASSSYPKMIMYPSGSDGQFTLILDSFNGGLSFSSSSGVYSATIGATNTAAVNPYGQRSLREIGFGSATTYPDLSSVSSGITGQEGLIVLTYS
jgi:hypothetical protein